MAEFAAIFYLLWVVLVIFAFNSGYRETPIRWVRYLRFYKVFRIVYYWIFTVAATIGVVALVLSAVKCFVEASRTRYADDRSSFKIAGTLMLICSPLMAGVVWLGSVCIRQNRHFDLLLQNQQGNPNIFA